MSSGKQEAFANLSDFVQENLSGIKVIKSFVQEEKSVKAFENVNKNTFNKNMKLYNFQKQLFSYLY